jgi:homoserine dehydrogenase
MVTELGIALLGAGTVGATVARELETHGGRLAARSGGPLVLRRIAERDPGRARALAARGVTIDSDAQVAVAAPEVDIVVELLGGLEPAGALLDAALRRGLGVVTANKAVIATIGHRLVAAVQPGSGGLAFEAAVGAAIPVLAVLRDSLGGDEVRCITAVINGTTNHILGRLAAGDSFDRAVADAQERGYAEADPSSDLDGHDAAQKLCILAWFAMGAEVTPEQVQRQGIREIAPSDVIAAARLGFVIRLVARAERSEGGLELSVRPTLVPRLGNPLGAVEGADNAVLIDTDLAGRLLLRGRGAGADAAASAVLGDIVQVARARREGREVPQAPAAPVAVLAGGTALRGAWLRVRVDAGSDASAVVTEALTKGGVAVEEVSPAGNGGELVILTGPASPATLTRGLAALASIGLGVEVVQQLDRLEATA